MSRNSAGLCEVTLYQDATIPWGDGGEAETWLEAVIQVLESVVAQIPSVQLEVE